jgi:putative restriction endonuclease
MSPKFASEKLKVGEIYSRKSLREIFPTSDATLNTGVFRPKNHSSVWLFVTRKKAPNQPKYVDYLAGKTIHWQGQTSGKSDLMIIEHKSRDLELLLFYRDEPKQYADAGFRYLGLVEYISHNPGHPSSFTLRLKARVVAS